MAAKLTAARLPAPVSGAGPAWRAALYAAAALGAAAGFVALPGLPLDGAAAAPAADPALTTLLRFMAAIKAAMAIAALALVDWRFRYPAGARLALSYIVAVGLMATGPVLIWRIATIVEGAALFHAGLALMLALAWADRGRTKHVLGANWRAGGREPQAQR